MDEQTALVLALQFVALFSIAGALLLYLVCKIGTNSNSNGTNLLSRPKYVLITASDTAIGLQLTLHLSQNGFRVFAGIKPEEHQTKTEHFQNNNNIITVPVDVTREDSLHESLDLIRTHLPSGQDGITSVICTNGLSPPKEQYDSNYWNEMFKTNVIGVFRAARTFQCLLKNRNARFITIGTPNVNNTNITNTTIRYAVEGVSKALRQHFQPEQIHVITLQPNGVNVMDLFAVPKIRYKLEEKMDVEAKECCRRIEFEPVLSDYALGQVELALTCAKPEQNYVLIERNTFWMKFKSR